MSFFCSLIEKMKENFIMKGRKKKSVLRKQISFTLACLLMFNLVPFGSIKANASELMHKVMVNNMTPEAFNELYQDYLNGIETYATGNSGMGLSLVSSNGYPVIAPPITIDGEVAYCLNKDLTFPNGSYYPSGDPYHNDSISSILYHGYPVNSGDLQGQYGISDEHARYYTQVALWVITGQLGQTNYPGYPYLQELINKGNNQELPVNNFSINPRKVDAEPKGDYQETPQINTSGARGTFTFPSDSNAWTVDLDGNNKNTFNVGESFKVRANKGYSGEKGITITTTLQKPAALKYNGSGGVQDLVKYWEDPLRGQANLQVKFKGTGRIELFKTDDLGNLLAGVKFGLFSDETCNNKVAEAITEADGRLVFDNVIAGTYFIKELETLPSHILNPEIKKVVVNGGDTQRVDYTNEIIKGRIKVIKVDEETGERLQGAEFDVIDKKTSQVVDKLVTGADGSATSKLLPFKEYIVKETKAPNKYLLNGQEHFVTINQHLQTIELTHQNRIVKGRVEINKEDSEIAGLKLAGAVFGIFNQSGTLVEELTTDTNGYAISGSLNYGDYKLREIKPAEGFLPTNQEWDIQIREDGKTYTYNIKNNVIKGSIQIVKLDEKTNKPIKGVKFGVYAENVLGIAKDTLIEEVITDSNGFAVTSKLRYGKYYLKELEAPDNYYLSKLKYPVSITTHNKVEVEFISNEPVEGKLRVIKTDGETKEALKGVKFEIIDKATDKAVEFTKFIGIMPIKFTEFITDENGEFITPQPLKKGDYSLVEVEELEGYNRIEPIDFSIDRNTNFEEIELLGKVLSSEIVNDKIDGEISIVKVDAETKKPLEGVEFEIKCISDFDKGNTWYETTNEEGKILKNALYGVYEIREVAPLWNYVTNGEVFTVEINEEGQVVEIEVENKKIYGEVELIKKDDETGRVLEGVEFELYNGNTLVGTYITDKNGKIKVTGLEAGNYYFKEISNDGNYIISDETYYFEIKEDGQAIEIEALNKVKKTDLSIVKIDKDTKEIVPGAKLKIKGIEPWNNHIETEVITKEEPVILNIPVGRVAITEEEAPEGYHLSDELVVTELVENEMAIVEFENDKIDGEISIVKVDAETKEPLAGVEFEITCVEGFDKGKTWNEITNEEGKILKNALYGKYEIREVAPLWNYVTNGEVFTVEINEEGQVVEIEVENKKIYGELELIKKDAETGRVLEGVEFELYNGNTLVGIYKTDKNGKIKVTKLEAGNYYFKEISNDGNYIISDEQIYFEIKEDKQLIELEVLNKVKEGEVDFSKTDVSTGELIEGATIHIEGLDEQNNHIDFEFVSTKEETRFKLPVGRYEFSETIAPEGYILSTEVGYFEILENEVVKAELKNKRIEVPVLPHTGGTNSAAVLGIAIVISLAGVVIFRKKKAN